MLIAYERDVLAGRRVLAVVFWVAVIAAPVAAALVAVAQFPAGAEIPLHWNAQNQIDNWGSPWTMVPVSAIMSGANLLLALMYRFSDALYNMGLVHGVSRRATRPFLCGTAVFLDVLLVGILIYWVLKALPYVG